MSTIVVDSNVLIATLDPASPYRLAAVIALGNARTARDDLVLATHSLAECLVAPTRYGDQLERVVLEFIDRFPIDIVDIGVDEAFRAAQLLADTDEPISLADALLIAVAEELEADALITTSTYWPEVITSRLSGRLQILNGVQTVE